MHFPERREFQVGERLALRWIKLEAELAGGFECVRVADISRHGRREADSQLASIKQTRNRSTCSHDASAHRFGQRLMVGEMRSSFGGLLRVLIAGLLTVVLQVQAKSCGSLQIDNCLACKYDGVDVLDECWTCHAGYKLQNNATSCVRFHLVPIYGAVLITVGVIAIIAFGVYLKMYGFRFESDQTWLKKRLENEKSASGNGLFLYFLRKPENSPPGFGDEGFERNKKNKDRWKAPAFRSYDIGFVAFREDTVRVVLCSSPESKARRRCDQVFKYEKVTLVSMVKPNGDYDPTRIRIGDLAIGAEVNRISVVRNRFKEYKQHALSTHVEGQEVGLPTATIVPEDNDQHFSFSNPSTH